MSGCVSCLHDRFTITGLVGLVSNCSSVTEATEIMHHWSVTLCWHSLLQSSSFHTTTNHNDGHVFTAALKHIELVPYTYLCVSSVHVYN